MPLTTSSFNPPTNTHGGGVDPTAVIGHAPESRGWTPGARTYPPHVSPSARVEAYVTVDAGLERCTAVGDRSWLMKHVHVGHDALIGCDCELAPGTVVAGHAEIGNGVRIGVNASVLPYRKVGAGARVGAGAVVTRDVPAGVTVVGNPARILRRPAESVTPDPQCSGPGYAHAPHGDCLGYGTDRT